MSPNPELYTPSPSPCPAWAPGTHRFQLDRPFGVKFATFDAVAGRFSSLPRLVLGMRVSHFCDRHGYLVVQPGLAPKRLIEREVGMEYSYESHGRVASGGKKSTAFTDGMTL